MTCLDAVVSSPPELGSSESVKGEKKMSKVGKKMSKVGGNFKVSLDDESGSASSDSDAGQESKMMLATFSQQVNAIISTGAKRVRKNSKKD